MTMAGKRPWQRFHLRKLVAALGGIVLWVCSGCAAKKADIPPPPPSPQVQPHPPGSVPPPPVPGQSPAQRGSGSAPRGWPPSGSGVGHSQPDLRSGPMLVHKVRYPGESVSIIAGWYTGEIDNWKILAEVNPDINPNVIHEGMNIKVPESMLETRQPMPKEYVDSFYPKSKPKAKGTGSQGESTTPAEEETPLFGPKR